MQCVHNYAGGINIVFKRTEQTKHSQIHEEEKYIIVFFYLTEDLKDNRLYHLAVCLCVGVSVRLFLLLSFECLNQSL
jgi:hypothetical protein